MADLKRTPLYDLHKELGARMVSFAWWELPVQYPSGILTEHQWCREHAALFDVSHMGQVTVRGPDAAAAFEKLVPGNIEGLEAGQARYTLFTNDEGGILDDLIVSNAGDHLFVVVNAACRERDVEHMREWLEPMGLTVTEHADRALLALQGPEAATALARLAPDCESLRFMTGAEMAVDGVPARVSRTGYTGEDGFEISVPAEHAEALARKLLAMAEVWPAGLGARDSLRLEAGFCLYGHDLDSTTTPIEAGLTWTIGKRRREAADFPGADVILEELRQGAERKLVGIRPLGRALAREGTEIQDAEGRTIGRVTSGSFGPTVGAPISMGYVESAFAEPGSDLTLIVRGKPLAAKVVELPFVPHRYHR